MTEAKRGSTPRERLLIAAQELFREQGVAATTPRQVLERSGVGQGSLHHHYPSKHDLALAAIVRTACETLAAARTGLEMGAPAGERLRRYLVRHRDALAGCRVGRVTSDPAVENAADLQEPVREYFARLIELIAEVFVEAGTSPGAARERAMTAVAVVQGGYVLARALGDAEAMKHAVTGLADLLDAVGRDVAAPPPRTPSTNKDTDCDEMAEMVALYDENGCVTGEAPRTVVREQNLHHGCVTVVVRNSRGQVYVHRRSETKDVYPGCFDVMAGGVLQAGENPMAAALREAHEELGVTGVDLEPIGEANFADDHARYHAFGYLANYDGPIRWQPAEVIWGAWLRLDDLLAMVANSDYSFAPDTLALMDAWMPAIRAQPTTRTLDDQLEDEAHG